ncbi:MAG: alpha/beta hydrolase [Alphaproteobacteria bacterium]|nr:alpha/beta hydrolase [Alphaproteobacteria bacterium]
MCKRAVAIGKLIEAKVSQGYRRKNIFLGGHSAGAWTSLLIKRHDPGKFNGVIAVAPAFNGQRSERFCIAKDCKGEIDAGKRAWLRAENNAHLGSGAPRLDALVFAFHCDRFGWPNEYPFAANASVSQITYPDFGRGVRPPGSCDPKFAISGFFDGIAGEVCKKIERDARNRSSNSPSCSRKRIAYCPAGWTGTCELDQHTKVHHSQAFQDWINDPANGNEFVRIFITKRRAAWANVNYQPRKTAPCDFLPLPAQCQRSK